MAGFPTTRWSRPPSTTCARRQTNCGSRIRMPPSRSAAARLLVDSIVEISENDLKRGEAVALPIALVVMLVVFGGFIAAGIPLVGAGVSIAGALGALLGFTFLLDIDTTVVNVVTAVGLGLSIDYGLLIVSRFREEHRARRHPGREGRLAAILPHGRDRRTHRRLLGRDLRDRLARSAGVRAADREGDRARGPRRHGHRHRIRAHPDPGAAEPDRRPPARPGALTRLPASAGVISRFGDIAPDDGFFSKLTRRVQRHPAIITHRLCAAPDTPRQPPGVAAPGEHERRRPAGVVDPVRRSSTPSPIAFPTPPARGSRSSPRRESDAEQWADAVTGIDGVESVGSPVENRAMPGAPSSVSTPPTASMS